MGKGGDRRVFPWEDLTRGGLDQNLPDPGPVGELVLVGSGRIRRRALFADDVVAKLDALVANEYRGTGNKLPHLMLAFAAEGTIKKLVTGCFVRHSPAFSAPT